MNKYWEVINFTGKAPIVSNPSSEDQNIQATACGIYIPYECQDENTLEFIKSNKVYSKFSFYKDWKSLREDEANSFRKIKQFIHYLTVYLGNKWLPDVEKENINNLINNKDLRIIKAETVQNLIDEYEEMLMKDIALPRNVIEGMCEWLAVNKKYTKEDIQKFNNKEARSFLYVFTEQWPDDARDLLRSFLLLNNIPNNQLINPKKINNISGFTINFQIQFSKLKDPQLKTLSTIFLHYKNIFIMIKQHAKYMLSHERLYSEYKDICEQNIKKINIISRLSKKYNTNQFEGFWKRIVRSGCGIKELGAVKQRIHELDNFGIIRLMQSINYKILIPQNSDNIKNNIYFIRNGKMWIKSENMKIENIFGPDFEYYSSLKQILEEELVRRLKSYFKKNNIKYYTYDNMIDIAAPTSAKKMIGKYPIGTAINLDEYDSLLVGIYWREEWGCKDLDLSFVNSTKKIGWNGDWFNSNGESGANDIMYSGDVIEANPDASEVICFKDIKTNDGLLFVNVFNGGNNGRFNLYIGVSDYKQIEKGYIIPDGSVIFRANIDCPKKEINVGVLKGGKLYLNNNSLSNLRVSDNKKYNDAIIDAMANKFSALPRMYDLFEKAGLKRKEKISERIKEKAIDINQITSQELINIFSDSYYNNKS